MSDREWALVLLSMLRGIRAMAQLQADTGSKAWTDCVALIDKTLEDAYHNGLH